MAGKKQTSAAAPKASPAPAVRGHNSGLDPKREAVFIRELQNVKNAEVDMAGTKGTLSAIYKRLENAGFTKEHISFAKSLEKKNVAEVIADFEMKIAICRVMGHAAGRQLDMLDKDRTPIEDIAYGDGLAAGKLGKSATNPYGMDTVAGQRWQQGLNDGNAFRNKALNEAVNGDGSLIKGEGGGEGSADVGEDGDGDDAGDGGDGDAGVSEDDNGGAAGEGSTEDGHDPEETVGIVDLSDPSTGDGDTEGNTDEDDDWDQADPAKKSA